MDVERVHTVFHPDGLDGFKQVANEKHSLDETCSRKLKGEARLNLEQHPSEVTGLGIIASLIVASGFLVRDGALRL
jgi:hypothetical protein